MSEEEACGLFVFLAQVKGVLGHKRGGSDNVGSGSGSC
jgi:hypothetical protein